ncbi:MAG: hypothetical protein H6667_02635 [Ardenticatenaceae bacterium]|nr:hypothetical protein [Ardenticatenaceae bacterium]MCB9445637.1 hypothetical protein [Ardenticatenaceae bacterium]
MKNGTEFRAFVETTAVFLSDTAVLDYFRQPLPGPLDGRLGQIVDRYMAAAPEQRDLLLAALDKSQRALFGIFGHREVTLAAREESRERLRRGLVGLALAHHELDRGSLEAALAVPHHIARKLGVNTVDLFDETAVYFAGEMGNYLRGYGRRSDVGLRKYGWREIKTPDGVKYKVSPGA